MRGSKCSCLVLGMSKSELSATNQGLELDLCFRGEQRLRGGLHEEGHCSDAGIRQVQ